jgi:hypothetical protein
MNEMRNCAILIALLAALLAYPAPADAAGRKGSGSARFRDGQARSDKVTVRLTKATPPAGGYHYEAWLISDDGQTHTDIGQLNLDAEGSTLLEWVSPSGENLLARYNRFAISEEANGAAAGAPSTRIAFTGQAAPELRAAMLALLVAGPDTPLPDRVGLATGLRVESRALASEGRRALNAAVEAKRATRRNLDESLLNRLAGINDGLWGDWDGDGNIEHASDTYGITRYARTVQQTIQPLLGQHTLDPDQQSLLNEMLTATNNILDWAYQTRNLANVVVSPDTDPEATKVVQQDITWLTNITSRGADLTNDGKIELELGEGGADGIYTNAQDMGRISFKAVKS